MNASLLPEHLDDLRRSGLTDEAIVSQGFYLATADQVFSILGFSAGPSLVIPCPQHESSLPTGGRAKTRIGPSKVLLCL